MPSDDPAAENDANMSGAPLPKANRVIALIVSLKFSLPEIVSRALQRYSSAVEPSMYIHIRKITMVNGTNR